MKRRRGYILIEAVVAMAIFSVGMISVQSALRQANITRALGKDRTDAHFLLSQLMGAVEIQATLHPGTYTGAFPDHPRFAYEYAITTQSIPKPPLPPNLPPAMREQASTLELPVTEIGILSATITWTRLGVEYSETAETVFPPERLPSQQDQEVQFRNRNDPQSRQQNLGESRRTGGQNRQQSPRGSLR
jgi:type II secretory pathway pseudopilin PulG